MYEQPFNIRRSVIVVLDISKKTLGICSQIIPIIFVAGAMLTMIAETMMPEAYFKGGSVVGMSTLMGFLVAIFFKSLE